MTRRPTDRTLRRWLRSGRPARVARLIDVHPGVVARLEAMSRLDDETAQTLGEAVAPSEDFAERTGGAVATRLDAYRALGLVGDLLGVGWRTGQLLLWDTSGARPDEDPPPVDEDHDPGGG